MILQDRLVQLDTFPVLYGSHGRNTDPGKGMCAMELAAWLAGEGPTDRPECVCPVIATMIRSCNDRMGTAVGADERRARVLRPLLPIIIGSRSSRAVEDRRMWMAADWSLRHAVPKLFRLTLSLARCADELQALQEITSQTTLAAARSVAFAARGAAWAKRREVYAAATAAAAAAAATAAATATATADADAADAATAAADAATAPEDLQRTVAAAKKAREEGGDWHAQYWAARKVADEVMANRTHRPFLALRDELDAEFGELVKRMVAVKEGA